MNREYKKNVMRLVKRSLDREDLLVLRTKEGAMVYGEEPDLIKASVFLIRSIYNKVSEKELFRKLINASVEDEEESLKILKEILNTVLAETEVNKDNE